MKQNTAAESAISRERHVAEARATYLRLLNSPCSAILPSWNSVRDDPFTALPMLRDIESAVKTSEANNKDTLAAIHGETLAMAIFDIDFQGDFSITIGKASLPSFLRFMNSNTALPALANLSRAINKAVVKLSNQLEAFQSDNYNNAHYPLQFDGITLSRDGIGIHMTSPLIDLAATYYNDRVQNACIDPEPLGLTDLYFMVRDQRLVFCGKWIDTDLVNIKALAKPYRRTTPRDPVAVGAILGLRLTSCSEFINAILILTKEEYSGFASEFKGCVHAVFDSERSEIIVTTKP